MKKIKITKRRLEELRRELWKTLFGGVIGTAPDFKKHSPSSSTRKSSATISRTVIACYFKGKTLYVQLEGEKGVRVYEKGYAGSPMQRPHGTHPTSRQILTVKLRVSPKSKKKPTLKKR